MIPTQTHSIRKVFKCLEQCPDMSRISTKGTAKI